MWLGTGDSGLQAVSCAACVQILMLHHLREVSFVSWHRCIADAGAPGLGPLSQRGEEAVFQEGYRSRQYCLRECTEVCALEAEARAKRPP